MPKKELNNLWEALGDILREASWPVKIGVVLGIVAGVATALLFLGNWDRYFLRTAFCSLIGLTAAGAFVGLAVGVGIDFLLKRVFPSDDDKRGKRRR